MHQLDFHAEVCCRAHVHTARSDSTIASAHSTQCIGVQNHRAIRASISCTVIATCLLYSISYCMHYYAVLEANNCTSVIASSPTM
eukprot:12234-Heterococcus_DN1.PRE.3